MMKLCSGLAALPRTLALALVLATFSVPAPALGQSAETLIETVVANTGLKGDIVKRMAAQKQLVKLGKKDSQLVVPLILAELAEPHGYDNDVLQQRIALVETLRDIGPPAEAAVPELIAILEDQDRRLEWVHFAINGALLAIGTPQAEVARDADALRTLEDWQSRASPAEIASAVAWHDFSIRRELRQHQLWEPSIEASVQPLLVLGPRARAAAATLLRALGDPRVGLELRGLLEQTLAAMGIADPARHPQPPQLDPLAEVIADAWSDHEEIRSHAIPELRKFAPADQAVEVLIGLLRAGKSPGTVANALREIGAPAALRAVPDLLPYLSDRRNGANVVQAVGELGAEDPAAVEAVIALLEDQNNPLRGLAASALGTMKAAPAVPALIATLEARDKYTRILAAKALGRIGPPAAEPAAAPLARLLESPDRDVQLAAIEALTKLGPAAAPATPALARLLESSDPRVKQAAQRALAQSGGQAASQALEQDAARYREADRREAQRLLARGDRDAAARLLRRLPAPRATQLARHLIGDDDTLIVYMASGALIRAGHGDETVATLGDMIASGRAARDLGGRFGYDWMHSDAPERFEAMFGLLAEYLEGHRADYGPEEQARIDGFLGAIGR